MADRKLAPALWIGVFVGALLGVVATLLVTSRSKTETFDDYRARIEREARERSAQPRPVPHDGGDPHGGGDPHAADPHGGDPHAGSLSKEERAKRQAATVHFMKKFVAALREPPDNALPNPSWQPLLRDPAQPFDCSRCHDPNSLDLDAMIRIDPGAEAAAPLRAARGFMIQLMTKWVARLNRDHAAMLTEPVTCKSCHAIDPGDFDEQIRVLPPLMVSFVKALREKPQNAAPAPEWKPLLKDQENTSMLCSLCHGRVGEQMEAKLEQFPKERPADYADNKEFMIHLMEDWVTRLNRQGRHLLKKAVVCRDCHAVDPRR